MDKINGAGVQNNSLLFIVFFFTFIKKKVLN